jgi:hypothetical protein
MFWPQVAEICDFPEALYFGGDYWGLVTNLKLHL